MYLMKDPPYENLIHFDQTWQLKLWNDEKKTAVQSQQTNLISNLYFNGTQTSTVMEIFHSWIVNSIKKKKIDKKTTGNCFSPLSYI